MSHRFDVYRLRAEIAEAEAARLRGLVADSFEALGFRDPLSVDPGLLPQNVRDIVDSARRLQERVKAGETK